MELQRIIRSWEMLTSRLMDTEPEIGRALRRSCRPIAAQRYRDGRLLLVLGCWWAGDQEYLNRESSRLRLAKSLGNMLSDQVTITIARWPGGMVKDLPQDSDVDQIAAPDLLQGLPEEAREEAAKCESVVQRLFFARAHDRGLRLQCQYPLLNYRLDFAIPEKRSGAEVMGWDWRTGPAGAMERRERQEHMAENGWRIVMFSGSQVLSDANKCVSELVGIVSGLSPRRGPSAPVRSPQPRKPFYSIGTNRPPSRGPQRPRR